MNIRPLALLVTIALTGPVHAGPLQDRWTAEARETRDGREYRTLLTISYYGGVSFNGMAEWKADVLCEMRDPGTGRVETVTGSAPAGMGQGAFEGVKGTAGEFHIEEPDSTA
uniref:hypothetical protein n=1 Tax=Methylobacterium sp. B34 TaxID=95563 RepID=UPI0005B2E20B